MLIKYHYCIVENVTANTVNVVKNTLRQLRVEKVQGSRV